MHFIVCLLIGIILLPLELIYILILFISSLFISTKKVYTKNSRYYRFLLNFTTFIAIKLCGIKIKSSGLDKIPSNTRFLLVCNHRSNFDPILTWYIFRKYDVAFISKPENFNIPIFGKIIRKCCFLPIDRKNPKNAVRTILKSSELIKNNVVSIGIYPEGTRSKNCVLLDFHDGVFKISQNAKVPVVICTIKGTENIHSRTPLKTTQVEFNIVEIVPNEFISTNTTHEISSYVRNCISNSLENTK